LEATILVGLTSHLMTHDLEVGQTKIGAFP